MFRVSQQLVSTRLNFWRQDNHPIECFTASVTQQKLEYIHNNPVNQGIVQFPEQYIYSSAANYADGQGLLEVEQIGI